VRRKSPTNLLGDEHAHRRLDDQGEAEIGGGLVDRILDHALIEQVVDHTKRVLLGPLQRQLDDHPAAAHDALPDTS
jgi:hypothetical protein